MVEDAEMPMIQNKNELLVQVKAASVHNVDINICHGYSKTYRRILNSGVGFLHLRNNKKINLIKLKLKKQN